MQRYRPDELFEVNENLKVRAVDIGDGAKAIIIDNFYKNPYDIRNLILNSPAPIWKNTPDGLNWKEYYDCRHQLFYIDQLPFVIALFKLTEYYFTNKFDPNPFGYGFVTNVFQWIKDQPKNSVGNRVHADGLLEAHDEEGHIKDDIKYNDTIATNVFFNTPDECHGGTALYKSKIFNSNSIKNYEREYTEYLEGGAVNRGETGAIYYDTEWENFWTIQKILPMKFNRCVMYEGHLFHGAYHVDNNFKEYPRLGQACFIQINDAARPMYQPML